MEMFRNARAVRLKSHHNKYLTAEDDEESVTQTRNAASRQARWMVEFSSGGQTIRLKSCFGRYLTASNEPFLLGMTGCKVTQTKPAHARDSSLEWQPIRDGFSIRLKTAYGRFLRANGGLPPWRNSITHDIPHRTATQEWILWELDVVEINPPSVPPSVVPDSPQSISPDTGDSPRGARSTSEPTPSSPFDTPRGGLSRRESISSTSSDTPRSGLSRRESLARPAGRTVFFSIFDESGHEDDSTEAPSIQFLGNTVEELSARLERETGLSDVIICTRNILTDKLHPLRLQLPPNNRDLRVVLVSASSKMGKSFA
ncbi:uncharacterized protein LOC144707549 [Wolffia australiana]